MEQQLQKKEQLINELKQALEIDCQKEEARIIKFIQKTIKELHKDGAVIGLSGGLDSSMCAYFLTKAIGKDKVLAVLLPERDSSIVNHEHAHLVAETLGLKTIDHDMTKTLQDMGVYDIGIKMLESEEEVARYTEKDKAKAKLFLGGYAYPDMISALYGGETSTKWKLVEKLAKKQFMIILHFKIPRLNCAWSISIFMRNNIIMQLLVLPTSLNTQLVYT